MVLAPKTIPDLLSCVSKLLSPENNSLTLADFALKVERFANLFGDLRIFFFSAKNTILLILRTFLFSLQASYRFSFQKLFHSSSLSAENRLAKFCNFHLEGLI